MSLLLEEYLQVLVLVCVDVLQASVTLSAIQLLKLIEVYRFFVDAASELLNLQIVIYSLLTENKALKSTSGVFRWYLHLMRQCWTSVKFMSS